MSATLRDIEHTARFVVQFNAEPLTEGRAVDTEVNGYVEHGAARAPHELDLRMRELLIVHAPERTGHHAASRIDLGNSGI
jgi:hypothetical protein